MCTHIDYVRCCSDNKTSTASWLTTLNHIHETLWYCVHDEPCLCRSNYVNPWWMIRATCLSNQHILVSLCLLSHVFPDFYCRTLHLATCSILINTDQTRPSMITPQIRRDQIKTIETRQDLHSGPCSLFKRVPLTYHDQEQRHRNTSMVKGLHQ